LIAYLKSDAAPKPKTIAAAPAKPDKTAGRVTCSIAHGELFLHLKEKRGERLRLRWDEGTGRERELPAGTYILTGYRRVAKGADGAPWIWSTTSSEYARIEVKAGETLDIDVRDKIVLKTGAIVRKGKLRLSLAFQVEPRLGTTLYRNGKRMAIGWEGLDAKGAVLTDGTMRYG